MRSHVSVASWTPGRPSGNEAYAYPHDERFVAMAGVKDPVAVRMRQRLALRARSPDSAALAPGAEPRGGTSRGRTDADLRSVQHGCHRQ